MESKIQEILSRLEKVKVTGNNKWDACCPAHEDHTPSLSITQAEDGKVLMHCHAGCNIEDILSAIDLKERDLFATPKAKPKGRRKVEATYDYQDEQGNLLYQVVRYTDKTFSQRHRGENGRWVYKVKGLSRVLYRLPGIIAADADAWIFVVEGEKDADNLAKYDLVATTNSNGAGQWKILSDDSALHNRKVVVIPDKDDPGIKHARDVCRRLRDKVSDLRYLELPGDGKDVSDWLNAGGTREQFLEFVESAPTWEQLDPEPEILSTDVSDENSGTCVKLGDRDPDSERIVLSPKRTLPTAEAFVRDFYTHPDGHTLVSYAGMMMTWDQNRYMEVEDQTIKNKLQPWLHEALRYHYNSRSGTFDLVDFESNPGTVNAALESIRTYTHLPMTTTVPTWLTEAGDLPNPQELLPCRSLNLHIPTGKTYRATPSLFTTNALDFDYDPDAPEPIEWLSFLDTLWPDDPESIALLQEWFGYCLTTDTSQHKMLLLVGPRRCGKGTIGRILTKLIGSGNVAGPTTGSLAGTFGLQPLIGKSLAIVSDARFTGQDIGTVVERLLCISGEDTLTIDRKHKESVTMKLISRFMMLTNELPRLTDASNALAGRFMILEINQSWFGREDLSLLGRLEKELPGILLWALQGWVRLREQGRFIQPAASQDAISELEDLCSPVSAFVKQRCLVGREHRVYLDDLYNAWQAWCQSEGRNIVTTKQTFGRDLLAAVSGIKKHRNHTPGGGRFYTGIGLDL